MGVISSEKIIILKYLKAKKQTKNQFPIFFL